MGLRFKRREMTSKVCNVNAKVTQNKMDKHNMTIIKPENKQVSKHTYSMTNLIVKTKCLRVYAKKLKKPKKTKNKKKAKTKNKSIKKSNKKIIKR